MPDRERRLHSLPSMRERRCTLRNEATQAERRLWTLLRRRQLQGRRFRRQHSVGRYVLDFYCPSERLAVELDGAVHDDPLRADYDHGREVFLQKQGIRIVRFENREVFDNSKGVLEAISMCFGSGST